MVKRSQPLKTLLIQLLIAPVMLSTISSSWAQSTQPQAPKTRAPVTSLKFPIDRPVPTPADTERAFPNLKFNRPLFFTSDGLRHNYVVEQNGTVIIFADDNATNHTDVFIDLSAKVNGPAKPDGSNEEGLLGLAFDPDFKDNGLFYLSYSIGSPSRRIISRFHASNSKGDIASEKILMTVAEPFSNHKGGMIAFGPDRMLYIGFGDGGSANDPQRNGQNTQTFLAKILRIDPRAADNTPYKVPADNPFVGNAAFKPEIWAYGIRNPWRFSFSPDGKLWLGDVGQDKLEEVDVVSRGDNLGWSVFEGDSSLNNPSNRNKSEFKAPIMTYGHENQNGGFSITGGYVYRGQRLPNLRGAYIYGDYVSGNIWALVYDGTRVVSNSKIAKLVGVSSFGEDQNGELYACSIDEGFLYRFKTAAPPKPGASVPEKLSETGIFSNLHDLTPDPGIIEYGVQQPFWSDGAIKRRWIALPNLDKITFTANGPWKLPVGTVLVKHFEVATSTGNHRLETRVLVNHQDGWNGYVYKWNADQSDALLLTSEVFETVATTHGNLEWHYPSQADCLSCHSSAGGRVLGLRTLQINAENVFSDSPENQLAAWKRVGLFDQDIGDVHNYQGYAKTEDASQPLLQRVKSYLAVNCAQCHAPGALAPGSMDLRMETPLAQMNIVGVAATDGDLGRGTGAMRIKAGAPDQSILLERMRRHDESHMPKISSRQTDDAGVDLIRQWILSLH